MIIVTISVGHINSLVFYHSLGRMRDDRRKCEKKSVCVYMCECVCAVPRENLRQSWSIIVDVNMHAFALSHFDRSNRYRSIYRLLMNCAGWREENVTKTWTGWHRGGYAMITRVEKSCAVKQEEVEEVEECVETRVRKKKIERERERGERGKIERNKERNARRTTLRQRAKWWNVGKPT